MSDDTKLSDPQQERFCLSCMLVDPGVCKDVRAILGAGDFYIERNRWVFEAICDLADAGKVPDVFFVSDWLRQRGKLEETRITYVAGLPTDLPTSLNAKHYARAVWDLAVRRRLVANATRIVQQAHDTERDPMEIRHKALAGIEAIHCQPPDGAALNLISGVDILTTDYPEPEWVIPRYLPVGLAVLAGKAKLGKSWFALQIAFSVASGGVVLSEHVKQGGVCYLALEDSERRLQRRMQKQGWSVAAAASLDVLPLGRFATEIGDLRDGGGDRLAMQIERLKYRLVIIDTLSRSCFGDQNDVEAMTRALTPLQEMAHERNCTVLMTDHHRKGFGSDPDAIGDILGSTAKGAMADTIWGLYRERGKAGAKLQVVGRDIIEEQNLALTWNWDAGCWVLEGDANEIELTERREEIVDALKVLGSAAAGEIAKAAEQDRSNTYRRLQDLVSAGLVTRQTKGKRVLYELSP